MNILGIARKGNYTKLREILYSQPDLVYEDVSIGCTLLHYAAMDGYSDLVELLIARGADADKKDNDNRTPLNYASYEGNFEVVKILLNTSKVNLDGIDNNGWAPVHIVAFEGYNDILKLFIEYDEMCIYARSAKQGTPLHYAANGCQVKTAQLLIENRAYVNTLDYVGKTPLDWVISRPNNKDIISLLRSYCGKMKGEINRKEGDIDFLSKFPKHVLWFVIRENLSAWEQITLLKSGIANWNSWRSRFPNVKPVLYKVELSGAKLREINFANACLSGAKIGGADLRFSNMVKADLSFALLNAADLRGADLKGANLTQAFLYHSNFSPADVGGNNLRVIDFKRTDLREATLKEADLGNANFRLALMSSADLEGAQIRNTDFVEADLSNCNLTNATFDNANLLNTKLLGVKGLETIKHEGPSEISVSTLMNLGNHFPRVFLQNVGVPNYLIRSLSEEIIVDSIQYFSFFISYSHQDEAFVEALYKKMQDIGLRVWYALSDIEAGKKIHEQVYQAISNYDKILIVLSKNSMDSEWVKSEIRKARQRETKERRHMLFPIRLCSFEEIEMWESFDADVGKDIAIEIREYYIPDFSDWRHAATFEEKVNRMINSMRKENKK